MTAADAPSYATGALPSWDTRNEDYPVAASLDLGAAPIDRAWPLTFGRINQGQAPKCVGGALGQDLSADPVPIPITHPGTMDNLYNLAQKLDEWPGEGYDGTSLQAGLKAYKQFGFGGEYRWASNVEEIALSLGQLGPVILAGPWLTAMFTPDNSGQVRVAGTAGTIGHCYMLGESRVAPALFVIEQTWGPNWSRLPGPDGGWRATISWEDVRLLLRMGTQAAIITQRLDPNAPAPIPPAPPPPAPPAPPAPRRTITVSGVDLVVSG